MIYLQALVLAFALFTTGIAILEIKEKIGKYSWRVGNIGTSSFLWGLFYLLFNENKTINQRLCSIA